jgi:hypothetical protein
MLYRLTETDIVSVRTRVPSTLTTLIVQRFGLRHIGSLIRATLWRASRSLGHLAGTVEIVMLAFRDLSGGFYDDGT